MESPAPFAATWDFRCGPQNRLRVLYDVDFESGTVSVLAIGVKDRNRLMIGNEEVQVMKIAPLADVKARLIAAYVDDFGANGAIVITRNGKAVAVLLVPTDDNDDLERLLLARSPQVQSILNRSRKSIAQGKGLVRRRILESRRRTNARPKKARAVRVHRLELNIWIGICPSRTARWSASS